MSRPLSINVASLKPKAAGTLVLLCRPGLELFEAAKAIIAESGLDLSKLAKAGGFSGKKGEALDIIAPSGVDCDRLLIVGLGPAPEEFPLLGMSQFGGTLFVRLAALSSDRISIVFDLPEMTAENVAEIAAGMRLKHYGFDKYKSKKPAADTGEDDRNLDLTLCVEGKAATERAIADRLTTVEGTLFARDLINEPPNVLGPVEFADAARSLSELGVDVDILTAEEMEKLGMGALLAVARGSVRPARMAIMQWNGGRKKDKPIAFVGKGVVFDTGGISIKPAGSMQDMKGDMGGAAAVMGLMKTLAKRNAKANVVGVAGLVENMPDGNAFRPGDIITSMSKQTIEVINTDAEGRLVLADALWYTQERFKPQFMIDLATLTGAIVMTFGHEYAGLFSNNDELSGRLAAAGEVTGELVWRLPLASAFDKQIDSRFADMKNTGGRGAGSITAAQFLQRFVNDVPWAHLDIAGVAFGGNASETSSGWAPGFGVALLDRLVRDHYEN